MNKFLIRWAINAGALYAAIYLLQIPLDGAWTSIIWLALIYGLVNTLIRPVLKLLSIPLMVLTLGLFTLVINTIMFWMTGAIGHFFGVGYTVDGFWEAFLGAIITSFVSMVLSALFRDELKGRSKRR
jgi:putative membrane protein